MSETQAKYMQKEKLMKTAVALNEPDYVPFCPKVGNYYARGYDISIYDAMKDLLNIKPGVMGFLNDFDPDLAWAPVLYPADPPEFMDSTYLKCPGPKSGLGLNDAFQICDGTYLYDEEFDEFLHDPTHFFITKVYPRKFKGLEALSKVRFNNPVEYDMYINIATFAQPEVQAALETLKRGGEASAKWLGGLMNIAGAIGAAGFPLGAAGAQTCPFDMFSDNIRGMINAITDIHERPEKLLAVLDYITEICINNAVGTAKALNLDYLFIPLHGGVDQFMSRENYQKFYWPGLQKLMLALIDNGVIPFVFCEGEYNRRLDIIKDIPKGKAIYMFEKVDIAEAKRILGDTACIGGNLATSLLAYGSKEEVVEETKKMIDICAPGGGFFMDCSIVLDNAKRENLEAWMETTRTYGRK